MMINRGHTPGNYHIRHDIRTRNASVEQWAAAGLRLWNSGAGSTAEHVWQAAVTSCHWAAVAALSPTQSQLAALAVDRVQCASCKSRGAGSRPVPSCGHHDPVPRKDSLDFTMLWRILQPWSMDPEQPTLLWTKFYALWKPIFARTPHQWPFKVYRTEQLITNVCKSRLVHSKVWGSAAAVPWVQRGDC